MSKFLRRSPFKKKSVQKRTNYRIGIFQRLAMIKGRGYFGIGFALKLLLALLLFSVLAATVAIFLFMRDLPSISSIEKGEYFQENTIIYDKDKKPIYTLFSDGKRTYIEYDNISQSIKDAIVSAEDKTFFENPGIDFKGLLRAGYNYITDKTDVIKGTSTLSQQLISKTLLNKERSVKRKVREAYLSYELNKNYSKEKILEMYLNRISFGNNANGIEEAAKTYFGKSAKDVGPLGASILASLPKGPTFYSPYSHRTRLMGGATVYSSSDPTTKTTLDTSELRRKYEPLYGEFKSYLSGMTITSDKGEVQICGVDSNYVKDSRFRPDRDGCIEISHDFMLNFLGDITLRSSTSISGSTSSHILEYTIGRKDFVAARMFEDGKIDGATFKKIVSDGLEFEFRKYVENIKYPYFVMYIKEYLEAKYGKDIDITQGLKVYTTLDPLLQEKAEELISKQVAINKKQYGANSAALISMDNKNGALLAMVGGPNYFDIENGGNNNMTLAKRQPGSSFKPIVYALAISKNAIGPSSPVADVKTTFSNWKPDNYDGKFLGVMSVEKALAYSRNIPAIKMYFLAGQEEAIEKYGQTLGLRTLDENGTVGGALALGAGEVRAIDLMQAYSVFANLGIKREVHAIDKIIDNEGNILEEFRAPEKETPIFSTAASYIMAKILANVDARPEGKWREYITIAGGRAGAVKTGTSDKKVGKLPNGEDKILPRDLWTAGFTPQITTVVWAGNVDGKETLGSCDGLNCAAPIWRQFMDFAHKGLPKEDWKKPEDVYEVTIVKSSGLLPTSSTPEDQKVQTIMAVKPTIVDSGFRTVQIDTLCNGPLSENTPTNAIGEILIPNGKPIIDGFRDEWLKAFRSSAGSLSGSSSEPCERPGGPGNFTLSMGFVGVGADTASIRKTIEGTWKGDRGIKKWRFYLDGEIKMEQEADERQVGGGRMSITTDEKRRTIIFEVIDIYGYAYRETRTLDGRAFEDKNSVSPSMTGGLTPTLTGTTNSPGGPSSDGRLPQIRIINPRSGSIQIYAGDRFNLRYSIDVVPGAREISVKLDSKVIYSASSGDNFIIPVATDDLSVGEHEISISVIDANIRTITKKISLTILPR